MGRSLRQVIRQWNLLELLAYRIQHVFLKLELFRTMGTEFQVNPDSIHLFLGEFTVYIVI